jgi:3-phosphoshikimate 1-carboxyvinyltransferase
VKVTPVSSFGGEIIPPPDKSLTHRAYFIASLCREGGWVKNPLRAEDVECTRGILEECGVSFEEVEGGFRIQRKEWRTPERPLWCGNSGTTMRLGAGVICGAGISAELSGDASLSQRPMGRIVEPLRKMGADITALSDGGRPPLRILSSRLHGISYELPVASAQVKSCLLFAGLFAEGETRVLERVPTRDHTERLLSQAGVALEVRAIPGGSEITVKPGMPERFSFTVPGDISSAAFFMVASVLLRGEVLIRRVGVNPTRSGVLEVLREAGADVEVLEMNEDSSEPVGDVRVRPARDGLRAFNISGARVPRLIDEIPVLAVLATQCEGVTEIRDAGELRVKESDRIEWLARGLRNMGAEVETLQDGLVISGPVSLSGGVVDSGGDHRLAMAFAVAGLVADGETEVRGWESVSVSFPDFFEQLRRLCH